MRHHAHAMRFRQRQRLPEHGDAQLGHAGLRDIHGTGGEQVGERAVDYGRGQLLSFDDCLEVEGDGRAFSDGGDSGSVVYALDGLSALGLLFAGSTTGGSGGTGLTYCNGAALALRTAGVTLL